MYESKHLELSLQRSKVGSITILMVFKDTRLNEISKRMNKEREEKGTRKLNQGTL